MINVINLYYLPKYIKNWDLVHFIAMHEFEQQFKLDNVSPQSWHQRQSQKKLVSVES